jgi:hypothetical protein
VCGSTCLAAPCDASQCLTCDSSSGTCVGCPSGQTCNNGQCVAMCEPVGTACPAIGPNSQCCSGLCGPLAGPGETPGCCIPRGSPVDCNGTNVHLCCTSACNTATNTCV